VPYHAWLRDHVYIPLGGRDRPVLATLVTFLVSGAVFELVLTPAVGRVPVEVGLLFLVQGVVVAVEKKLSPRGERRAISGFLAVAALALALAATPWLSPLLASVVM